MSPACLTPLKQRRLADARFLRSTSIPLSSLRINTEAFPLFVTLR
jgi:hypothetical protein